jgi:hypothetical protein
MCHNDNYDQIGLYAVQILSIDLFDAENDVETEDIFPGNELKETGNFPNFYSSAWKHELKVKIDTYTEDIKLIEISFFDKDAVINTIDAIGKVTKIKMINPSLYVILKLSLVFFYQEANLVDLMENSSKDLIDELYLEPKSLDSEPLDDKQMHFIFDLLKRNPKLKKLYLYEWSLGSEFEDLEKVAPCLLEN